LEKSERKQGKTKNSWLIRLGDLLKISTDPLTLMWHLATPVTKEFFLLGMTYVFTQESVQGLICILDTLGRWLFQQAVPFIFYNPKDRLGSAGPFPVSRGTTNDRWGHRLARVRRAFVDGHSTPCEAVEGGEGNAQK